MWHVSSRSGVATLRTAIHLLHPFPLPLLFSPFLVLPLHFPPLPPLSISPRGPGELVMPVVNEIVFVSNSSPYFCPQTHVGRKGASPQVYRRGGGALAAIAPTSRRLYLRQPASLPCDVPGAYC